MNGKKSALLLSLCLIGLCACDGIDDIPILPTETEPQLSSTAEAPITVTEPAPTTVVTVQTEPPVSVTTAEPVQTTAKQTLPPDNTPLSEKYAERRKLLANKNVWTKYREEIAGINASLEALKQLFPDGSYWNSRETDSVNEVDEKCLMISDTACNHDRDWDKYCNSYESRLADFFPFGKSNMQCLGFVNMLSDILYGKDAEVTEFNDYDSLCVGDTVRLVYYDHSVLIVEKTDEYVKVVECNSNLKNDKIVWGRQLTRYTLRKGAARFFRRTPVE